MENAKGCRKAMLTAERWDMFTDGHLKLKTVIHVLSLTCSTSRHEHNWSGVYFFYLFTQAKSFHCEIL